MSSSYGCCERKTDLITLGVAIASIAGIAVFLRQAVIDNSIKSGRKKRSTGLDIINIISLGTIFNNQWSKQFD